MVVYFISEDLNTAAYFNQPRLFWGSYKSLLKSLKAASSQEILCKKVKGDCFTLSVVNGNIWAPVSGDNTITVLDGEGGQAESIVFEDINPICVVQIGPTEVFIGSFQGLHVAHTDGTVMYKVCGECIHDVCLISHDTAIAYGGSNNSVLTCKYIGNRWNYTSHFNTKPSECYSSIAYHDGTLFISDGKDQICRYNLAGVFLDNLPQVSDVKGPSVLKFPKVCGIDSEGRLLISDRGNQRVLVYSSSAGGPVWKQYKFKDYPRDIIVPDDCSVYVLFGLDVITKYQCAN